MKRSTVVLLVVGAVIAWLLYVGPESAVETLMRALPESEAKRRAQLQPAARAALDALREDLSKNHGIETYVGQTARTKAQQATALSEDKSDTENSWHLLLLAVDLYPIDPATGQPDKAGKLWNTLFRKMHEVAPRHGWKGIAFDAQGKRKYLKSGTWDGGHLQYTSGQTYAAAKAKFLAEGGKIA